MTNEHFSYSVLMIYLVWSEYEIIHKKNEVHFKWNWKLVIAKIRIRQSWRWTMQHTTTTFSQTSPIFIYINHEYE